MKYLANNCRYSGVKVTPKNWGVTNSVKKNWVVYYRFYDPAFKEQFPKGRQVTEKGMNSFKTADDRRDYIKGIIPIIEHSLEKRHFNPFTGYITEPVKTDDYCIDPDTPFIDALDAAHEKLEVVHNVKLLNRSVLRYFKPAAIQCRLSALPIKDVRRRHVLAVLAQVGKAKGVKWTASNYNFYRSHLQMLFKILTTWETMEHNPVDDNFPIRKHFRKKRKTLTKEERIKVDEHLRKTNYRFWLFTRIFFRSGARETEMMLVQKKDVDLVRQSVSYGILKGNEYREEERPITTDVLNLWEQALVGAEKDDYIFSCGLRPGPKSIRPEQITRRWRKFIKMEFGIEADFYSLKHSNSTETARKVGTRLAAMHNKHTEAILKDSYDMDGKEIEMEILKGLVNEFAPA